ncbi:hypothetical protein ACK8N7_34080 [Streptomyces griseobrunneus]
MVQVRLEGLGDHRGVRVEAGAVRDPGGDPQRDRRGELVVAAEGGDHDPAQRDVEGLVEGVHMRRVSPGRDELVVDQDLGRGLVSGRGHGPQGSFRHTVLQAARGRFVDP